MKKKKKGRPSLLDIRKRNLEEQKQQQQTLISSNPKSLSSNRRSKLDLNGISPASDWISGDGGYDDDDERKEKKVKLVVRLPPSNHHCPQLRSSANSLSLSSASYGSDSNADGERSKINAAGDRSGDLSAVDQVQTVEKAMETLHGSPLESGPTPPLPDKKLLVFILDRLQKKDIYGVFSEPVDPNELPDYHEIIGNPMDFGTVRKKLDEGCYSNLEEFEEDVFLICSNAMQYNAPDTIYFRQARSIQELAKRDFENLRQVNDDGEPQPRIVRRGRPPSKNLKKPLGSPSFDRVGPESSSDATLATVGDNVIGSNSYNLRKGSMPFRFQSNDAFFRASRQTRNKETYSDSLSEWNNEFPASILKAEAKNGKKQFSFDENRRATYREFYPSAFGHEPSVLTNLNIDMKQLMGVGLHSEHGYPTSLARFAANLGPVVWNIASKKIERVLPIGVKFGPGWVGENEASQRPLPEQKSSNNSDHDGHPLGIVTSPISGINSVATHGSSLVCKDDVVEAVRGQNSDSELAGGVGPGPSPRTQQKHMLHSDRNGFNAVSTHDLSSETGMIQIRPSLPTSSELEVASVPSQMLGVISSNTQLIRPTTGNHTISEPELGGTSGTYYENIPAPTSIPNSDTAPEVALPGVQPWQVLPSQHRQFSILVPPDLNVRFQAPSSPSPSFRIGSPWQPDLALQL